MYPNLAAEMARKGIDFSDIAKVIGKDKRSVYNKIHKITHFTLEECRAIRDAFFLDMELDYLFKED